MNSKRAVVTGASRGIGREIALKLAENGFAVIVNYSTDSKGAEKTVELIREKGFWAKAVKADVSIACEAEGLIETAVSIMGGIDVLVNNAGKAHSKLFTEVSEEDYDLIMNTNLKGAFFCSKAAVSSMIKNGAGKIINITSVWGETGASMEVLYSSSKGGLIGLTKALAKEAAASGIAVNAVSPGVIETDMIKAYDSEDINALDIPMERTGKPGEVAEVVAFLAGDNASYITGQIIRVNGGFYI